MATFASAWIFGVIVYIGIIALFFYIGYRVIKCAVKNGILEAHEEMKNNGEGR